MMRVLLSVLTLAGIFFLTTGCSGSKEHSVQEVPTGQPTTAVQAPKMPPPPPMGGRS